MITYTNSSSNPISQQRKSVYITVLETYFGLVSFSYSSWEEGIKENNIFPLKQEIQQNLLKNEVDYSFGNIFIVNCVHLLW